MIKQKRILRPGLLSLLVFILSGSALFSQDFVVQPVRHFDYPELLIIDTDRDVYICGETLYLKHFKVNFISGKPYDLSSIIYTELINAAGSPVVQLKSSVKGIYGSASLSLPDTLATGIYTLRSYTRWMQNFSADYFAIRSIIVINPFRGAGALAELMGNGADMGGHSGATAEGQASVSGTKLKIDLKLSADLAGKREKVSLTVSASDANGKVAEADFSVSVIRKGLISEKSRDFSTLISEARKQRDTSLIPLFLPEPEGEIISGTAYSKTDNNPLIYRDISLGIVGRQAAAMFSRTNEKGEFSFILRENSGIKEFIIQPSEPLEGGIWAEINPQFSASFSTVKARPEFSDVFDAALLNNAVIAMQVSRQYEPFRQVQPLKSTGSGNDIYGDPVKRVRMADYIELSNIREVIREIIPEVYISQKNSTEELRVIYRNKFQELDNQALVLIDGVPVSDLENLLSLPASLIDVIDIVDARYFYHDFVFDGLVSFKTRKGNLEPAVSLQPYYRQVFEGVQKDEAFYAPVYNADSLLMSRIPDFRNTIFWEPSLKAGESGEAHSEFYTSDEPGEYLIKVVATDTEGRSAYLLQPFRIK
jgi:hypothetical protein